MSFSCVGSRVSARRPQHLPVGHAQLADPSRRARRRRSPCRDGSATGAVVVICAEPGDRRVRRRGEPPEHGAARRVDRLGLAVGRRDEEHVVRLAVHRHAVQVDRRRVDRAVECHLAARELRDVRGRDAGRRRADVAAGRRRSRSASSRFRRRAPGARRGRHREQQRAGRRAARSGSHRAVRSGVFDPGAGRGEQRLGMQVGEPGERQVAPALEAEVAPPPVREELAVEAVQALELEEPVGLQQRPAQRARPEPGVVVGAQEVGEHREVQRQLGDAVRLRPRDRLGDQVLHQPVRRVAAAAHRRERVALARGRRHELQEAADGAVGRRRDGQHRVGVEEQRVHRHREAALGPVAAPLLGDGAELGAQRLVGVGGREDAHHVARPSRAARPTAAPCGSRGRRARTRPAGSPPRRRGRST